MTTATPQTYRDLLRLMLLGGHNRIRTAALVTAIGAPILCALFLTGPNRWDLFERSGVITTTIGLILASRRYLNRGIIELALTDHSKGAESNILDLVEDVHATKLGMAVSALGTVIWGLGSYLRWWTFGFLAIWAGIAAFEAWRDFVRLRNAPVGLPSAKASG